MDSHSPQWVTPEGCTHSSYSYVTTCPHCYASKLEEYRKADDAGLEREVALLEKVKDLESRLDRGLEALRSIDRSDPRYDANEVHHAARYGMGWTWDRHRQVWLNEKGEDLVRGRDYDFAVERRKP